MSVEDERSKFLVELKSFKKEFPLGFRQVFSGNSITSIKDTAKRAIDGLLQPIKNEINQGIADLLSETGLVNIIEDFTEKLSTNLEKWKEKLTPSMKKIAQFVGFITGIIVKIIAFIGDILSLIAAILDGAVDPNDLPPFIADIVGLLPGQIGDPGGPTFIIDPGTGVVTLPVVTGKDGLGFH